MDPDCEDLDVSKPRASSTSEGNVPSIYCHEGDSQHRQSSPSVFTMHRSGKLALPTFKMVSFAQGVGEGLRRQADVVEEQRRRLEEENQKKREEREKRTAMFVTPGLPPLAMAPTFNWITLERTEGKSDLQFERLFPRDKSMRSRAKDVYGELLAVRLYSQWVQNMENDEGSGEERRDFYTYLGHELWEETVDAYRLWGEILEATSQLKQFEFDHLDKDGGTKGIESALKSGHLFRHIEKDHEILAVPAYKALFQKYPLIDRFEATYLISEGTAYLESEMAYHDRLLDIFGEEVREKWGWLEHIVSERVAARNRENERELAALSMQDSPQTS